MALLRSRSGVSAGASRLRTRLLGASGCSGGDYGWLGRRGLSQSALSKGLEFEEQVVAIMAALRCELQPTQMSRDGGIDHQGVWSFPDHVEIEVVTQCKNEKKPVGVQYVREFHGVLSFFPANTLGVFASSSGFSVYAQRYFLRMTTPAVLCSVDPVERRISSFLLNARAQVLLPKLTVASQFIDQQHQLVLTYGSHILGGP